MIRFIFLLAGFVFFSTSGWANDSNFVNTTSYNWNNNQSFIFMENGIEFSVFQDGQFDFYMPNHGPNFSVGLNPSRLNFSFNTGYNYNPYIQYDSFGAIIQIQNTPVFYDPYGRIQQVGSIFINYNNTGRVSRIGNMQIMYRHDRFWRPYGFISPANRNYVWRPWHRYYSLPANQFCLISTKPYRQFYRPKRHIYYRPYINNYRDVNVNRRVSDTRQNIQNTRSQRYVQSPRNRTERNIRSNVQKRQRNIYRTREARITRSYNSKTRNQASTSRNSRSITGERTKREGRTRSTLVDDRDRNSQQARRSTLNQRQPIQNSRMNVPSTNHTRRAQHENVNQNKVRSSIQNTRSSSARTSSETSRNRNLKRNTTFHGRSSGKIR
jgi:hypothetical protein